MSYLISAPNQQELPEFVEALNTLTRQTIDLPKKALDYYERTWTETRFRSGIDELVLLMLIEHEQIQGVLLGTKPEGGVGTIIWVLVNPDTQGKGYGAALFSRACKVYSSRGAHKIKLTVPERNTVQFYEKQGMRLEGEHLNHWWNADFWAMGMTLKGSL